MLAIVVVFLFCLLYTVAIAAQPKRVTEDPKMESIASAPAGETHTFVQQLGFGKRVNVKLKNGSKVSGRITGLAADQFVVTDSQGTSSAISYADVTRITRQKEKLGIFHRPWVVIMFTAAGVATLIVGAMELFN